MHPLLAHHKQLLERWRRKTNLVGPGSTDLHYDDAEAALADLAPSGRWGDLGSGAGFPGVIFAARFPDCPLDLVDSRQKRCAFLNHVLATAPVDTSGIQVINARVETLPDHSYDGLVSRAFAPPLDVLEHARRLLVPGGTLVLFLQADTPLPESDDFEVVRETPYTVAGKDRRSVTLTYAP